MYLSTLLLLAGLTADNPVPSISSVSPTVAPAGSASLRVVITGAGFVESSKVRWNGERRETTYHSSTSVSAIITQADLALVGIGRVTVRNPAPGGGVSGELTVRVVHLPPSVSSLTPSTAVAGSGDLTVTVAGQNFISAAQAHWNGAPRPTQVIGPGSLRMTVSAADLRASGTAQVTVLTTVGTSVMRSAPVSFTITFPLQVSTPVTPQLAVTRFYVGGQANPAWVTAGQSVPLYAQITGVSPSHYRVAENAQLSGAEWRAATGTPTYTFPTGTTGSRTLWYQVRLGDGRTATLSPIVSDAVEVVPPYSTAGVVPETYGTTTGAPVRLECPRGEVLTGVHGDSGLWLDNIGLVCAERKGAYAYTAVYGGLGGPTPFLEECPLGYVPSLGVYQSAFWNGFLGKPVLSCPQAPAGVWRNFDVGRAEAVGGERTANGFIECPDGAFPVGLDVFLARAPVTGQRGVSALGLICARLRS